jgi:hypothetical protein
MLGWFISTKSWLSERADPSTFAAPISLMPSPRKSGTASDCGLPLALEARSQQSKDAGARNTPTRHSAGSPDSTVKRPRSTPSDLGCASRRVAPLA